MNPNVKRVPLKVIVRNEAATHSADNREEKYGGVAGSFILEGELLMPRAHSPTVALFMHPTAPMTGLPFPFALAAQGLHVCTANSRYCGNDSALLAEKCVLDVGHFVRHLRHVLGYTSVILCGWSGGGALMALYQSQATHPTITHTPSGDIVNMKRAKLIAGDMLLLIAAHIGRAPFLREALDPTIWGTSRHPSDASRSEVKGLQIYGGNAVTAPYSIEFLQRYRMAQRNRMERITAWAASVDPNTAFVVEGTMADPRWMDLNIDPNERGPAGSCFLGPCHRANDIPAGLARFCTARGWLSQWADGVSELDALKHLPHTNVPTLVMVLGADDGVPSTHGPAMCGAIPHPSKELVNIKGAQHYFIEPGNPPKVQRKLLGEAVQRAVCFINQWSTMSIQTLQSRFGARTFPSQASSSECSPLRGPLRGFSHVALVCSDMAATVKFYGEVLGMPVVKTIELPDKGQHFFLDCGDVSGGTLAFFWWPQPPAPHSPGIATASRKEMASGKQPRSASGSMNHVAFQIAKEDMEPFRKRIQSKGVWVSPITYHAENETGYALSPTDPSVNMISVYLWGPDGELIEFAAATEKMYPPGMTERVLSAPGRIIYAAPGSNTETSPRNSKL